MSDRKDCCLLFLANETFRDEEVEDVMSKVQRGICEKLPDTLITEGTKEEIWLNCTTPTRASSLIKQALKGSLDPRKMTIFLRKLEDAQRLHAKKIQDVYNRKMLQFPTCPQCQQVPEVPLSEPRQEHGPPAEGERRMEIVGSTS